MNHIRVTKEGWELIPREETEDYKAHKRLLDRLRQMTPEERFQTLVDAGIYSQDGELTLQYGGSAPNKED